MGTVQKDDRERVRIRVGLGAVSFACPPRSSRKGKQWNPEAKVPKQHTCERCGADITSNKSQKTATGYACKRNSTCGRKHRSGVAR